jgi:hypothetical protein
MGTERLDLTERRIEASSSSSRPDSIDTLVSRRFLFTDNPLAAPRRDLFVRIEPLVSGEGVFKSADVPPLGIKQRSLSEADAVELLSCTSRLAAANSVMDFGRICTSTIGFRDTSKPCSFILACWLTTGRWVDGTSSGSSSSLVIGETCGVCTGFSIGTNWFILGNSNLVTRDPRDSKVSMLAMVLMDGNITNPRIRQHRPGSSLRILSLQSIPDTQTLDDLRPKFDYSFFFVALLLLFRRLSRSFISLRMQSM